MIIVEQRNSGGEICGKKLSNCLKKIGELDKKIVSCEVLEWALLCPVCTKRVAGRLCFVWKTNPC